MSRGAVVVAVATSELEGEFDVVANLGVGGGVPGPGFTKRTPFRSVSRGEVDLISRHEVNMYEGGPISTIAREPLCRTLS